MTTERGYPVRFIQDAVGRWGWTLCFIEERCQVLDDDAAEAFCYSGGIARHATRAEAAAALLRQEHAVLREGFIP